MNKNELKEGEIYYVNHDTFWMIGLVTEPNNGDNTSDSFRGKATHICSEKEFNKNSVWCYKAKNRTNRLATPEEKHWLETCIKLNRFVSFEEAMESFPKEVIKVKPFDILSFKGIGDHNKGLFNKEDSLYRFELSNSSYTIENLLANSEYVIINSVINEEGNIFMIDDTITTLEGVNKGKSFIIVGFRLNKAKTMICAITNVHSNGIGIDKIEHFIEPKVEVNNKTAVNIAKNSHYGLYPLTPEKCHHSNETLLEKAKRLYPVGTKFNNYKIVHSVNLDVEVLTDNIFEDMGRIKLRNPENSYRNYGTWTLYENSQWAEIVENVKVGDKFRFKQHDRGEFIIDKIQDSNDGKIIFYKTDNNYELPHNRVLLKNITIIK